MNRLSLWTYTFWIAMGLVALILKPSALPYFGVFFLGAAHGHALKGIK